MNREVEDGVEWKMIGLLMGPDHYYFAAVATAHWLKCRSSGTSTPFESSFFKCEERL